MNKAERENFGRLCVILGELGLAVSDVSELLRCERVLTRWACRECGDGSDWMIERDDDGIPYNVYYGNGPRRAYRIPDREAGALKRAEKIAAQHGLTIYNQTDPRGCMLYLLRPGDIPEGKSADSLYNRGIAICV